ncbi:MAG: hypothetical protein A3D10_06310 [Omnitrophica WOR_2 bacterium RIFCSPHIGHO2_02_FULL_48_11]|nr:MAG: hypothetical protein A3D10_06310 [Omnitrophica WOR_2 bacterium RIFCSPHIGHO2_02_FULL_48_11]
MPKCCSEFGYWFLFGVWSLVIGYFMQDSKKIIIFLICLGNIAISFNTGAVAAAIPLISEDLGVPDFSVAKLVPFYMLPYGCGALLYAFFTKYVSYRRVLSSAMFCYAFFSLLTGLSSQLPYMLLAQIGAGVAAASSTPLSLMIIGELFEKDVRGRLVGTYFGCSFFASLVGMFFMGVVHWRWLFFIPAGLALVTSVSFYCLKTDVLRRVHAASVNYFKIFFERPVRRVFIFIFLMSFLYHAVHKWYGLYLHQEYGLEKGGISLFLIMAAMCGLAGQNIGGYLSDKKGRMLTCFIGGIILALGTMSLWGHYPVYIVPVILGSIAMGWTINHNSVSTILTDFPDEYRPMIASLNSSVRFASGGLGFLLSTAFVEKSFGLTFLGIGVLFLGLSLTQQYFITIKK